MSKRRKGLATPKGEAKNSLTHAKAIFSDLRQNTDPNATEQFVHRLNDFVRTAQTMGLRPAAQEPATSARP